jgi:flavin-dependent dehydrogenase
MMRTQVAINGAGPAGLLLVPAPRLAGRAFLVVDSSIACNSPSCDI